MKSAQAMIGYRPAQNELDCLAMIRSTGGARLYNIAYPLIYKQVNNFDDRASPEDCAVIREIANKFDVDLIC